MAKNTKNQTSDSQLFPKLDPVFEKRLNLIFYITLGVLTLFSVLLFDMRISEGGDDSAYLLSAKKFISGEVFPGFHGAFYSMVLGWFIKLFGFKLTLFKLTSMLFLIGGHALLFFSLRKRISPFILGSTLIIMSMSSGLIYFGSQTYTEAFFLLLQGLFFLIFFKYIIDRPNTLSDIKKSWGLYLALAASMFMLSATRNVGIVSLLTVLLFFFTEKRFYQALFTFAAYLPFNFGYGLYKKLVWDVQESDMSGQMKIMMQKHPYNKALGTEDLSGLYTRVIENMKNYLSRVLLHETGLKDLENKDTNLFIALLIIALLTIGLVWAFRKKDKVLKFILLYLGMSLGVTFIALHQMWSQARLVIVYIPLIVISISWTFAQLSKFNKMAFLRAVIIGLLCIIGFKSFVTTVSKTKSHQKVLSKNLAGNKYYGYTPDWINFLKMSSWSAKKVDEGVMIISRKPSMSFIYGNGREFYPMYRIPIEYADSVMVEVNASKKEIFIVKENDLRNKPANIVYTLKKDMLAAISADNTLYSIFLIEPTTAIALEQALDQQNISYMRSGKEFQTEVLDKAKETSAINPDKLVQKLLDNNVQYAIVGSLRVNPKQKSDRTINTVSRYLAGIQLKYPGIFSQVHQIGHNDSEPARLYKFEFDRYGLKPSIQE